MKEAIITTERVFLSSDMKSVEVNAVLDEGEIVQGMYLRIPMHSAFYFEFCITQIAPLIDKKIHLTLDCGGDEDIAHFISTLNFEDETLWVKEDGED